MKRSLFLALALLVVPLLAAHSQAASTIIVGPDGYSSIQAGVNAAQPGDTVLVRDGVYQESVVIATNDITLTGESRNGTILEGGGVLQDGITVVSNGVTVKTMTAQDFGGNGFVASHVDRFRLTDLFAKNNVEYGLYAIHSTNGSIDHSYATGHGDSGVYLGETDHCNCEVAYNVAWGNMLGYSGTANSWIRIHDNEFFENRAGILPNVLPTEFGFDQQTNRVYGLQVHTEIDHNYVHDNNNKSVPQTGIWTTVHVPVGEGISIAGGWLNDIHDNVVTNNHLWGIGLFWLSTPERGNFVHDNTISGDSRWGIWWDEWGEDNCFVHNDISGAATASDPSPLPTCPGLVGDLPCPEQTIDLAACRASSVGVPSATKDAFLADHSLNDKDPNEG